MDSETVRCSRHASQEAQHLLVAFATQMRVLLVQRAVINSDEMGTALAPNEMTLMDDADALLVLTWMDYTKEEGIY